MALAQEDRFIRVAHAHPHVAGVGTRFPIGTHPLHF